jgi:hypothetical protein
MQNFGGEVLENHLPGKPRRSSQRITLISILETQF